MHKIILIKRYFRANIHNNINTQIKSTETGKITPSKCPAIKQAYNLGCYIGSPNDYHFDNSSFIVKRYNLNNKIILDPGIIGTPDSNNLYARIDTGFSFSKLNINILATPILTPTMNLEFQIPPVVYPKGYTGPILAPVFSQNKFILKTSQPIIQLIPLGSNYEFEIQNLEIKHENFEGLFYDSEFGNLVFIDKFNCTEQFNL